MYRSSDQKRLDGLKTKWRARNVHGEVEHRCFVVAAPCRGLRTEIKMGDDLTRQRQHCTASEHLPDRALQSLRRGHLLPRDGVDRSHRYSAVSGVRGKRDSPTRGQAALHDSQRRGEPPAECGRHRRHTSAACTRLLSATVPSAGALLSRAVRSALYSTSSWQVAKWPPMAARWRAVWPNSFVVRMP
jgi:hypothetical protein